MNSSATPGRSRLGLRGAEPPGRVRRHVHQPVRRRQPLALPVLGIGGEKSLHEQVAATETTPRTAPLRLDEPAVYRPPS
jgi:hypothetical protein